MGGKFCSTILGAVMRKVIVAAAFAAGGLAFAAPAAASPETSVGCSNPCVAPQAAPAPTGAPWTDFFATYAPWEKVFDPNGDGQGAWENGVQAVNGGAWEKVFPPAPDN